MRNFHQFVLHCFICSIVQFDINFECSFFSEWMKIDKIYFGIYLSFANIFYRRFFLFVIHKMLKRTSMTNCSLTFISCFTHEKRFSFLFSKKKTLSFWARQTKIVVSRRRIHCISSRNDNCRSCDRAQSYENKTKMEMRFQKQTETFSPNGNRNVCLMKIIFKTFCHASTSLTSPK